MENPIQRLQELGFSQYEAQAYVALLHRSPLNGYELAKLSGVPRANIYKVLDRLEERSAVVRLELEDSLRYAPVPPEEVIRRLRSRLQTSLDGAQASLDEMARQITGEADQDYIWNARGYGVMLEHARALIDSAESKILLAVWPEEVNYLASSLIQAQERGVDATILCMAACPQECHACRGNIYRYHVLSPQPTRWLVIVADDSQVLAGQVGPGEEALAVRTHQKLMVDLANWFIRHTIALAAILVDLDDRLDGQISPETRAILSSMGPDGQDGGWLEYMRQLLNQRKN